MDTDAREPSRVARSRSRPRWGTVIVVAWSVLLAVALLGRALGPGYVLTYDMVWVPDLAVRPDVWGLGSALPRAVPSDAVVALLDELVPGALLQKLALLVPLVAGGIGAARLVGTAPPLGRLPVRLLAVALWQWNPFVVERLLLGQWTVLVGYGLLPWVLLAGRRWREDGRLPTSLWWLLPLGSLSASAGLATAIALGAGALGRGRRTAVLVLVAAANAPWWVAGALHAGSATTSAAGADAFALHAEGVVPAPVAALTLGGVWNLEVVPTSRTGALGVVAVVVLLGLAAVGARSWWEATDSSSRRALLRCWAVGWGVAVLTWLAPGPFGWLDAHVPGAAVLRDGARLLSLCAPLLVVLVAHGAARLLAWPALTRVATAASALALMLLPVVLLPDAAWGASGQLRAVDYPADYAAARTAVAALLDGDSAGGTGGTGGDVVVLPLTAYRAPGWNGGRKTLDPLPRYLSGDVVSSDSLQVGGVVVSGEDPRVAEVAAALGAPTAAARAAVLARIGVGVVVTETDAGPSPRVAGRQVLRTPSLTVTGLAGVVRTGQPGWWTPVLALAWTAFLALPLVGAAAAFRRRSGRSRRV